MGFFRGPNIVKNGLVLCLDAGSARSYTSGSTVWNDLSGNNYTGSLTNGPTYSSANGGSIVFDGTNDHVICPIINLANNGTISLWFYRTGNGSPDAGNVVDLFANVSSGGTFGWTAGINVSTNKLDFYIANNGGFGVENFSNATINSNTWYNAVFTYNGSSKIIYVNGVQDSSFASSVNGTNTTDRWGVASRVTSLRCFQGYVANASLYNRALSASEIAQNYNAQKSRFGL